MSYFNNKSHISGGNMYRQVIKNIFALLFAGLVSLSVVSAQPVDQPRPPQGGPMSPKQMVSQLKKDLNLTDEQSAKIQKIFEAQREEMRKMFDAAQDERDAMFEKMEKQKEETNAKIVSLLTDEQKKKFEKIRREHRQRPPQPPGQGGPGDRPAPEGCPDPQQ